VFGGELSAWLYYSDKYGFNRNQQRYHWRWVDNNFKAVTLGNSRLRTETAGVVACHLVTVVNSL
jgi:hypothetical protein